MPDAGDAEARAEAMARQLVELLAGRRMTLALAESCTAGLVSDMMARVSGASAVLWGSWVCYTADAKRRMLGLEDDVLERYGLVSGETARAMAVQARKLSGASLAAAVTGLAGPLGDGSDTPVGTVWLAVAEDGNCREQQLHFQGTRAEIRMQAAAAVVAAALDTVTTAKAPLDKNKTIG